MLISGNLDSLRQPMRVVMAAFSRRTNNCLCYPAPDFTFSYGNLGPTNWLHLTCGRSLSVGPAKASVCRIKGPHRGSSHYGAGKWTKKRD